MSRTGTVWLALAALAALAAVAGCGPGGGPGSPGALQVRPSDPAVVFQGRVDSSSPDEPVFSLSGTTVGLKFKGTWISARLEDLSTDVDEYGEERHNFYDVWVDGQLHQTLELQRGERTYVLAQDLADTQHEVKLFKRTEAWIGATRLKGFQLEPGGAVSALERPARRLEFIGDSVTVGLGVEGADASCRYAAKLQNHAASYAAQLAQTVGAEHVAVAASGVGVAVNFDGTTEPTIRQLYERVVITSPQSRWGFDWKPDAVVVNLGTSDLTAGDPGEAAFVSGYVQLLERVRQVYPEAHIFVISGPMLTNTWTNGMRAREISDRYLRRVVEQRAAAGDARLQLVNLPVDDGSRGYGCGHHPSKATHRWMADRLAPILRTRLGW